MPLVFDPSIYPALGELCERLRELAGESAYRAGRDYLRRGTLKEAQIVGLVAQAVVAGSTDYRVSVTLNGAVKVTCTCPAHRRNRHCKHIVAVCVALIEDSKLFAVVESADIPRVVSPERKRRDGSVKRQAAALKSEQQRAGLALVDRLLEELTAGGIAALGREQQVFLANAAETVRALKLRRLGNQLMTLHHLAANDGADAEPGAFAHLLCDISVNRQMVGAHLEGYVTLDTDLADDLRGRTYRDASLPKQSGLELIPVADQREDDGEFRIDSIYLVDLTTSALYVERQITPRGIRGAQIPERRLRLLVDEAGIYPGVAPQRIKLLRVRRAPLTLSDVDRCLAIAIDDVATIRRQLVEALRHPLSRAEPLALFRPAHVVATDHGAMMYDRQGQQLPLDCPASWSQQLFSILPENVGNALFAGVIRLGDTGPRLQGLGVVGHLRWANGPFYPDLS